METEYTTSVETVDAHAKDLALTIISRMYSFCEQRGIKLLILDIPTFVGTLDRPDIRSSLPGDMLADLIQHSDGYINGEQILKEELSLSIMSVVPIAQFFPGVHA